MHFVRRLTHLSKNTYRDTFSFFVLASVLLFVGWIAIGTTVEQSFVSSEVNFTDSSKSGFSIVPASCPSNPHCPGQCDNPPRICNPEPGRCSITFNRYAIAPGESAILYWTIYDNYGFSTINGSFSHGIGSVPPLPTQGSAGVSPSQTTTYSFTGTYSYFGSFVNNIYCSRTLSVSGDPGTRCPDGSPRPAGGICPGGDSCPDGSSRSESGSCSGDDPNQYPTGGSGCPVGWTATDSGGCKFTGCPPGYFRQGQQCIKQCTPQYFCSGNDLYYKNAQCSDSFTQACAWGCTAGVCNPPPAPQGDIRVAPALVKSGDTTQVIWSTQNTSSCTVTGTNGNSWNNLSSGSQGKTSSPITEQVIFTLLCNGLQGATPPTFTDTATVNLIPFWQEE